MTEPQPVEDAATPETPWWAGAVPEVDRPARDAMAAAWRARGTDHPGGVLATASTWWASVAGPGAGLPDRPVLVSIDENGAEPQTAARLAEQVGVRMHRLDLAGADVGAALHAGHDLADRLADEGAPLLLCGTRTGWDARPAAVVGAALGHGAIDLRAWPVAGQDDTWIERTATVRDLLRSLTPHRHDVRILLDVAADPVLAAVTALLARSAQRRTPSLLGGTTTLAAALIADRLCRGTRRWSSLAHDTPDPVPTLAAQGLGYTPLLGLGVDAADGTGALTALPVLQAAITLAPQPQPKPQPLTTDD